MLVTKVQAGHRLEDICRELLADLEQSQQLGEGALTKSAAGMLHHADARKALEALK